MEEGPGSPQRPLHSRPGPRRALARPGGDGSDIRAAGGTAQKLLLRGHVGCVNSVALQIARFQGRPSLRTPQGEVTLLPQCLVRIHRPLPLLGTNWASCSNSYPLDAKRLAGLL